MKARRWHQLLNGNISNWSFGFFYISCEKVIRLFHILNGSCASIEIVKWIIIVNIRSFCRICVSNNCLDMIDNLFASMKYPSVASGIGSSKSGCSIASLRLCSVICHSCGRGRSGSNYGMVCLWSILNKSIDTFKFVEIPCTCLYSKAFKMSKWVIHSCVVLSYDSVL